MDISDDVTAKLLKHDTPVDDEELVRDRETGVIHRVTSQDTQQQEQTSSTTTFPSALGTYD